MEIELIRVYLIIAIVGLLFCSIFVKFLTFFGTFTRKSCVLNKINKNINNL
jgi:hypothetical protein